MAIAMTSRQFIDKAIKKYGAQYSYVKSVYTGCYDPITITCYIHGDFECIANRHLDGRKECDDCKIARTTATKQKAFIDDCAIKHNGKYSYMKTIYTTNGSKIIVICPIHGEF